jgi:lycopene cyclase domain-containing protein
MSKYMSVLLLSLIAPLMLSFWPGLKFWRNLRALIYTVTLVLVIFGAWDCFAVWRGHWHFAQEGVWPLRILNLPVEEILFFIVIPFCCIFTWETVKYFKPK